MRLSEPAYSCQPCDVPAYIGNLKKNNLNELEMVSAFTEWTCLHILIQFHVSGIPLLQIEPEGMSKLIIDKINEIIAYV